MKFSIFFKIEDDPEIYELLADQVKKNISKLRIEELLEILVNLSHSLSPET